MKDTYYEDIEKILDKVYCTKLQSQVGLWFVNQITGEVERLVSVSGDDGNPATFRRPNGQLERGYLTDYLQD